MVNAPNFRVRNLEFDILEIVGPSLAEKRVSANGARRGSDRAGISSMIAGVKT
jgi:hypothetical protein